jgi:aminoglycoside phosphotransferase (APT) family kinase protein
VCSRLDAIPAVTVEEYVGGVDAGALLPWDAATGFRGLAAALEIVGELHRRTPAPSPGGDELVERWVGRPLATVGAIYRSSSWQASALRRLGDALEAGVGAYSGDIVWTHGDYTPGNIRVTPDGREVLGVVDWGGSRPGGLGAFDTHLLLIAGRAIREHREVGRVVTDLVSASRWPAEEERLLAGVDPPFPLPTLVLLCWLHHVDSNLRKATCVRKRVVWRALNVDAVLRRFSA